MKIAVIGGTGRQGYGLAHAWAETGLDLVIGSRDAARAAEAAAKLNQSVGREAAAGADYLAAAQQGDVVVLSVPYASQADVCSNVQGAVQGKVVVDVTNPLDSKDWTRVNMPPEGSASERTQALLGPGAKVVCAFQNVSSNSLLKPEARALYDVFVCSDHDDARAAAIDLANRIGMRGVDAGPLHHAQTVERLTGLLIAVMMRAKKKAVGVRVTGL